MVREQVVTARLAPEGIRTSELEHQQQLGYLYQRGIRYQLLLTEYVRLGDEPQRYDGLTLEGTATRATQLSSELCGKSAEDRLARPEQRPIATQQHTPLMLPA
jgi:hypothetical protein